MFTGLIQIVGHLARREPRGGDVRLHVDTAGKGVRVKFRDGDPSDNEIDRREIHSDPFSNPFSNLQLGESIAVNGVCLTVVEFDASGFAADVSNETLALTTLGALSAGAAVNLERALRVGDRLGGHLVSGHVDGIGAVERVWEDGRSQRWRFSAPKALLRYVAHKGSIAIDGVSLTVNLADERGFEVNLVPHTVAHTAFATTPVGAQVNLEVDQVARYVERLNSTREWA